MKPKQGLASLQELFCTERQQVHSHLVTGRVLPCMGISDGLGGYGRGWGCMSRAAGGQWWW